MYSFLIKVTVLADMVSMSAMARPPPNPLAKANPVGYLPSPLEQHISACGFQQPPGHRFKEIPTVFYELGSSPNPTPSPLDERVAPRIRNKKLHPSLVYERRIPQQRRLLTFHPFAGSGARSASFERFFDEEK